MEESQKPLYVEGWTTEWALANGDREIAVRTHEMAPPSAVRVTLSTDGGPLDEDYVVSKGWRKVGWREGSHVELVHEKYTATEHGFFVSAKFDLDRDGSLGDVDIWEEDRQGYVDTLFQGRIRTKRDFDVLMSMLNWD